MAKSSREQIDIDETKILSELQKNSNANIDTIARHCGFSRQKVWRAIKRLEKSRMIWGYTAIVDEQKQGLQRFILLIKRSRQTLENKTADQIASDRLEKDYSKLGITVENSYYIHGEYDWVLIFTAQDIKLAKKFSDLLLQKFPGVVSKMNLMQVLMTQRSHNILNPDKIKLREFL